MTAAWRVIKALAVSAAVLLLGRQDGGRGDPLDCLVYALGSAHRAMVRCPLHPALVAQRALAKKTFKDVPHIPCCCGTTYSATDLGLEYEPRYLRHMDCDQLLCRRGHRCHPYHYNVTVLRREGGGKCSNYSREWRSVAVYCYCTPA